MFRKVGETVEWGSGYVIVAQSEGLAPGATSKSFTLKSTLGYHSLKPRADMLTDPVDFVDDEGRTGRQVRVGPVEEDRRSTQSNADICRQ